MVRIEATSMETMQLLTTIGRGRPRRRTPGLPDPVIRRFAEDDPRLRAAVQEAVEEHEALRREFPDLIDLPEDQQIRALQHGIVNFYGEEAVNPYVPLAARGPWIITSEGAVIHDSGGYGMLGLGHSPEPVLKAMSESQVMANVMTANFSQARFVKTLRSEIGQTRGACPFHGFLCMNSGSEAVSVAARLADVNARIMTDPGGRHAKREIQGLSVTGSFHGRTDRPAQYSDSTWSQYERHLASFRGRGRLKTIPPNDIVALEGAFRWADDTDVFIEAFLLEPVMGEGNPGLAITPEFYRAARRLTNEHGSLLLIDSIQAGLRATGYLSIVDYPGFEGLEAPDLETYSKALNAGQYPLSVLAMNERAAGLYRNGIYGNTLTTNPRGLDVAVAVLSGITPEIRENIRVRGKEFVAKLEAAAADLGGAITGVQGTGLLLSCELSDAYRSHGRDSVEEWLRSHGIGVIHGGRNALRFTPHFAITSEEIDLVVSSVHAALSSDHRPPALRSFDA